MTAPVPTLTATVTASGNVMSAGGSSGGIPEGAPVTLWNNLFKEVRARAS